MSKHTPAEVRLVHGSCAVRCAHRFPVTLVESGREKSQVEVGRVAQFFPPSFAVPMIANCGSSDGAPAAASSKSSVTDMMSARWRDRRPPLYPSAPTDPERGAETARGAPAQQSICVLVARRAELTRSSRAKGSVRPRGTAARVEQLVEHDRCRLRYSQPNSRRPALALGARAPGARRARRDTWRGG